VMVAGMSSRSEAERNAAEAAERRLDPPRRHRSPRYVCGDRPAPRHRAPAARAAAPRPHHLQGDHVPPPDESEIVSVLGLQIHTRFPAVSVRRARAKLGPDEGAELRRNRRRNAQPGRRSRCRDGQQGDRNRAPQRPPSHLTLLAREYKRPTSLPK
jgi:hypothetical protein